MMSLSLADAGTIVSLAGFAVLAFREFRLIRANRRKVIAEGSDLSTQAADRMLTHWEGDNRRLREDNARLISRIEALERKADAFEQLLREHGISVPSLD